MSKVKTATRTLSTAGPNRTLHFLNSPKAIGTLVAESSAEADCLVNLMFDASIVALQVQPEKFDIPNDGDPFSYIPDVMYKRKDGRIGYQEFKADLSRLPQDVIQRYQVAGDHLRSQGFEFDLIDAKRLTSRPRFKNLNLLHRYAYFDFDSALLSHLRQQLTRRGPMRLGDFRQEHGRHAIPNLFKLLWEQALSIDIDSGPFTGETTFREPT